MDGGEIVFAKKETVVIMPKSTKVINERRNFMPAKWTADLLGEMHLAGVTAKQLAAEVGWNPKYLSVVLNGHKEPKGAEDKLKAALERLVLEQSQRTTAGVQ